MNLEARLREACEKTRRRYVPGAPEKYPEAMLEGLRLLDAEALLRRLSELEQENEQKRVALVERLGSYQALIGRADVSREAALGWDGPVLARAALSEAGGQDEQ